MAIVLNPIVNPDKLSLINSNFTKLAAAINESLVWRNGNTAGETSFTRDLDMNGYQILNAYVGEYSLSDVVEIANGANDAAISAKEDADRAEDAADRAETAAEQVARERVNIKDFGGIGDGVTVNDSAFQQALSLAATKPISLYIPPGIYKITTPQTLSLSGDISFKMFGEGSGTSVILVETGGDGFIFNTPGNYSLWKTGPGRTTVEVSGLSIATTQPLVGNGISVNGNHVSGRPSATIVFNDLNVTSYSGASGQFFDTGIRLRNCSNVVFTNLHMYLGSGNTTSIGVNSFSDSISNGGGALHFTDCTLLFGGIQILVGDQQEGLYLTNCELVGGSTAVKYEPNTAQSGLHIIGGHMSSKDYNIYIHRLFHFEIIGGLYFNSGTNPAFTHIYGDIVNQFTISGNVFNGSNATSERGIHIGAATDGAGEGGIISGNFFSDLNIGLSLSSASNNIKESSNLYRNCTTNVNNASSSGNNLLDYRQYHATQVFTLTGGATSETVNVTVNGSVFKTKPVSAMMNSLSNSGMLGFYDFTNSTTTNLVFTIRRIDEGTIPANSYRFSISAFGTQ